MLASGSAAAFWTSLIQDWEVSTYKSFQQSILGLIESIKGVHQVRKI